MSAALVQLLTLPAPGQGAAVGTVEGRIVNARSGEYVEHARITVEGTSLETFSDADGNYRISNVPAGAARLKVFYTGAVPHIGVVDVTGGATAQHSVTLAAAAGTESESSADPVKLSKFVVDASREMDAAALAINEQRFAPNIKNVVSMDEFGSVAESNVGEFLKFMPGITVDYNAGNPREVSINGVPTANVPVMIDGFNVASTGSGATGRAVALDFLGINNASRVEVSYSPTPESQGMALAGSVNVVPRSAFGRSKPVFNGSVYVTMRDNARDFHKTPGPRKDPTRKVHPGFDFSWIVPVNKRFGFALSAGSSTNYTSANSMTTQWRGVNAATNGTTFPHTTPDRPYLSQYIVRVSGTDYERRSYGLTLDYKLSNYDRLSFAYQWSSFSSNNLNRVLTFNVNRVVSFSPTATEGFAGAGSLTLQNDAGIDRLNRTYMPTFTWRHDGPIWKSEFGAAVSFATNRIRGVDKGFFNLTTAQRTGVTVSFDDIFYLRPGRIIVTDGATGAPVDPYDLGTYALSSATAQRRNPSDEQNTAYANARRDFHGRVPLTIKGGLDARKLTRQYRNHSAPYSFVGRDGRASTTPVASDDSATPFLDRSFSQKEMGFGFPRIQWVGPEAVWDGYQANPGDFVLDENATYRTLVTSSKRAEELISSAYVRGDLHFLERRLKVVGGVRAEQTNIEAHAQLTDPTRNVQRDSTGRPLLGANGRPLPITANPLETARLTIIERGARTDKEFLTLFPNINASYQLRENVIARASYYYSIGRPDLNQYSSGITLPDTEALPSPTNRITVNNAGIKPWNARTLNVRFEYYFAGVGQASVSAFRRDFTDFFGNTSFRVTPEFLALYNLDAGVYGDYDAATQENIANPVRMTGLDFNYKQALTFLPHWARGIQVFCNGSAMRATGRDLTSFAGMNLIPRNGSWGLSLTREKFNVRANWNYRGRQRDNLFATTTGIEPGTYNWTSKRLSVDLLGEYHLRRNISLFANIRNLRDQPIDGKAYGPNTPSYARFRMRSSQGALWTFGLKGVF